MMKRNYVFNNHYGEPMLIRATATQANLFNELFANFDCGEMVEVDAEEITDIYEDLITEQLGSNWEEENEDLKDDVVFKADMERFLKSVE